jgi:hypothetical protein
LPRHAPDNGHGGSVAPQSFCSHSIDISR